MADAPDKPSNWQQRLWLRSTSQHAHCRCQYQSCHQCTAGGMLWLLPEPRSGGTGRLLRTPAPEYSADRIRQILRESQWVVCSQFSDFTVCGLCRATFPSQQPVACRYLCCV